MAVTGDDLVSGRSSPADALVSGRSSPADSLQVADAGRASRIRSLVDEHVDFIWRSLRRLGVLEADLADAAQQVFLVAARKLDLVQAGKERAFLFQTAIRVASDSRRTLRRRREVSDEVLVGQADDAPGPDDYAEARMRRAQLDRILDALPIELRAVFVLSQIEELTMAEIAALTDTPPGTVASRLRRARELFRQEALRAYERESGGGA
jgi:RNA polymerase sigma-70 factor (ECF subfamily)